MTKKETKQDIITFIAFMFNYGQKELMIPG